MSEGLGVMAPAKHAVEIDAHQGGDKAKERPGANEGVVDHHMVDRIDHAKHHRDAKKAMADMGHYNVSYFDGGMK
jgi:hypothetical protein